MKVAILLLCFVASICALKNNTEEQTTYTCSFQLGESVYSNVPPLYSLEGKPAPLPPLPIEDILKEFVSKYKNFEVTQIDSTIINDFADRVFTVLHDVLISAGLDPVKLPDVHKTFNYTFIITIYGALDLTSGLLNNLSTVHRANDVILSYSPETKYLQITVPVAFNDLDFNYRYSASILDFGPTGGINGKVKDIALLVKVGFNTGTLKASLDDFAITNFGDLSFRFTGNPIIDWLVNLITEVVSSALKAPLSSIVESVSRGGLESVIQAINDFTANIKP